MRQITLIAAALMVFAVSCNNPKSPALETETIEAEKLTPLFEDAPYTFKMEAKIEWPTSGPDAEALEKMQRSISGLLFGNEIRTTDIEYAISAYNEQAAYFYRSENEELGQGMDLECDFMLNWSEYLEGSFLPIYGDYVSYVKYIFGYSGGAHGMDAKSAVTFDLKSGKVISENDLFVYGYEKRLTEILRERLLNCGIDRDMLFEPDIFPSENFYLTSEGITYIYQRYEIGPYAIGIVEVAVPWTEIQNILR